MLTRLWFILSLAWAALCLAIIASGSQPFDALGWGVWLVIFGPLLMGPVLKLVVRYVVTGSLAGHRRWAARR